MAAADFVCVVNPQQRFATPTGFAVVSSMDLPLFTSIIAVGMAALIGYDQVLQRHLRDQASTRI